MRLINRSLLVLMIGFLISAPTWALDSSGSIQGPYCSAPTSSQDVVVCAREHDPNVVRKRNEVSHLKLAEEVARQIPNPELDAEMVRGSNEISSSSVGILQPIEWGGKRSSRIGLAKAKYTSADSELKQIQADTIRETVSKLHRLRQVEQEKKIWTNTIKTLENLVRQQSSRLNLSPEQKVTLSVYRMALADTKIRLTELSDEERSLATFFRVSAGYAIDDLVQVLPKVPVKWPELDDSPGEVLSSPGMTRAIAEQSELSAELDLANSDSWPALKLGPIANSQFGGGEPSESFFGLRIMMDIPVFNLNSGGRSFAHAGVLRGKKNVEISRIEENLKRSELLDLYRGAVSTLQVIPQSSEVEREFQQNEALTKRGLISGPLLIEFHRQRAELTRSRHNRELTAIEALWHIYQLDGRIFMENL